MTDQKNTANEDTDPSSSTSQSDMNDDDFSSISPATINTELNELFMQRLEYLQLNMPNDLQLRLLVYQEWVDALLRSTQAAIKHKEAIEANILQTLKPFHHLITTNAEEVDVQCQKCRWDIEKIIQFIQRAFHYNDWDMTGLKSETKET